MKPSFDWRDNERFIDEIVPKPHTLLDDAATWIGEHLSPDEVFDQAILETWAYDNGFKKFE